MALMPTQAGGSGGNAATGKTRLRLARVFAVFFILGGVTNINDVLIPKLKGLFQLSHFQANLVQFAFFTSYALFSIPAGMLMARIGYIRGLSVGFAILALASSPLVSPAHPAVDRDHSGWLRR